ncbi:MAG: MFS transporter [Candidatus Binatia bacterium]|nr:MFS transporter [Candidatus Binatia bacterium]
MGRRPGGWVNPDNGPPLHERPGLRAALVVFGGLICQMGLGYNYVFGAVAPDIITDFGWTKAEFSGARAPQLWVMALASPLVGFFVVRFGARAVLVTSTVLLGGSFLLLSGMGALWQLYAILCVQALSVTGLGDITVGQLVSRWFGRHRGLALGIVYTGSNLGGALLVRSAGLAASPGAWRDIFQAMGGVALLVMLPVAFFAVREPRGLEGAVAGPAEADAGDRDLSLPQALRTRSFWVLAVALATFFFYFVAILDHLVLHLTELGWSAGDARTHLSNAILIGIVSKIGFGWIADRLAARTATLLDYGLLAVSSFFLLFPANGATTWIFVVLFGFSAAARDVVYPLVIVHCFGVRAMAQIYGVLMLALPAGALGAWFAASVSDASGGYAAAFLTFAILNVLAFAALLFVRDEREIYST